MRTASRIGLIVAIPILIMCAFALSARPSSAVFDPFTPDRVTVSPEPSAPADLSRHPDDADDADGAVDLYGNEVTDAVAKYKADAAGALYELHSPQTEVPRLASPKS